MSAGGATARFQAAVIAGSAGWVAAMVATVPMQLCNLYADATGSTRSVLWSLGAGLLIWLLWSLSITGAAWLCGGLPAIAMLREDWLLRHRGLAILIGALLSWSVVLVEFKIWQLFQPAYRLGVWLFTLYSLLLVIFAVVASTVYLRRVSQISDDSD